MRVLGIVVAALALFQAQPGQAQAEAAPPPPAFDTAPWLEDLDQLKAELSGHYSHLEWAVHTREANLPLLWGMAQSRLKGARNEPEAREVFDRFLEYFGDGHLKMAWDSAAAASAQNRLNTTATADCGQLGFRSRPDMTAVLSRTDSYAPLQTPDQSIFPAGVLTDGQGRKIGVLRIQGFDARMNDAVCPLALAALDIQAGQPCDDDCRARIGEQAWDIYNAAFIRQVVALKAQDVAALAIDLAGNGGGSEWAEVAARILTPVQLQSAVGGMVRHPHSAARLDALAGRLAAIDPTPAQAPELARLRAAVAAARAEVGRPCDVSPMWRGEAVECAHIVRTNAIYPPSADLAHMRSLPWGPMIFSPARFDFDQGVWRGPLMVLVDQKTGSAAEQFAGVLQQNDAAVIVGAPTVGGGCGYTAGGIPTVLKNSGARVLIPDCVRYRRDGSDDNDGVDPDVLVGFRPIEGDGRRAARALRALPQALTLAEAQRRRHGG